MKDYQELMLGKATDYPEAYDPSLLTPFAREGKWRELGIEEQSLPFKGVDIWTAWEMSWLNSKGKPVVAVGEISVPADSPNLIESKSLKLYLNSLNQHRFEDRQAVKALVEEDLSKVAGAEVVVKLFTMEEAADYFKVQGLAGDCIDDEDVSIDQFEMDPTLLQVDETKIAAETLHSHLLKSNCPVTNQPDWASVVIQYRGPKINRASLLKYLCSYRQHNDFHEQCVERLFVHLQQICNASEVTVYARYVRRGGLDINPFRSNLMDAPEAIRLVRQ